jgi:hypothetical protein
MSKQDIRAELYYSDAWHDLVASGEVYSDIVISTIRKGFGLFGRSDPGATTLSLRNADGRYNPENPLSPIYGIAGVATPMRLLYPGVSENWEDDALAFVITENGGDPGDPWARTTDEARSGSYSFGSPSGLGENEYSYWKVNVPAGMSAITFDYRVSTEGGFTYLAVYVDGGLKLSASGEVDWTNAQIDVSGASNVAFYFLKYSAAAVGSDAVWVDNVRFDDVRWSGEALEWAPVQDIGAPRRCVVTGGGIMTRLGIGRGRVFSAISAAALAMQPTVYLPLTDGSLTTIVGTVIPGEPGYGPTNEYTTSAIDGPVGDPTKLPELAATASTGAPVLTITPATLTGDSWTLEWAFRLVRVGDYSSVLLAGGFTQDDGDIQIGAVWTDGGAQLYFVSVGNGPLSILLEYTVDVFDSAWHQGRLTLVQSGSTATATMYLDGAAVDSGSETMTMGPITRITLLGQSTTFVTSASMGHITVIDGVPDSTYEAFGGYVGELAAERFRRLVEARGLAVTIIGDTAVDSRPMGPQPIGTLPDVLYDCVTTDGGTAYENTAGGLTLRCLGAMYRQTPAAVIPYGALSSPFRPVLAAKVARNDVTATRPDGSSARYEVLTGPLSTQAPPNGIGVVETRVSTNPQLDSALGAYASWVAGLTTVGGVQYDQITIDVDVSGIDVSAIEIGTMVTVTDIPPIDDPATPKLIVTEMRERIDTHRRMLTLGTRNAIGYDVADVDGDGFLDCSGSTLSGVLGTGTVSVGLLITDSCTWTHADGDYLVVIGGEHMLVTAVGAVGGTLGAYTQTLTVTRSVNGVVKTHAIGEEVHVVDGIRLAL